MKTLLNEILNFFKSSSQQNNDKVIYILEREMRFYREKFPELLKSHFGKAVLIKGTKVIGIFETTTDAWKKGFELFGKKPFLVELIWPIQEPLYLRCLDYR